MENTKPFSVLPLLALALMFAVPMLTPRVHASASPYPDMAPNGTSYHAFNGFPACPSTGCTGIINGGQCTTGSQSGQKLTTRGGPDVLIGFLLTNNTAAFIAQVNDTYGLTYTLRDRHVSGSDVVAWEFYAITGSGGVSNDQLTFTTNPPLKAGVCEELAFGGVDTSKVFDTHAPYQFDGNSGLASLYITTSKPYETLVWSDDYCGDYTVLTGIPMIPLSIYGSQDWGMACQHIQYAPGCHFCVYSYNQALAYEETNATTFNHVQFSHTLQPTNAIAGVDWVVEADALVSP